ncbi:hypothetical protein [Clostridium sp.]|uniref:hypothetical protein n=1 Tax=Clostridium sp. TaxID=1506 RepID=UPI002619D9E1|nr:hypothetical protein [Clostridium sp.]
MSKKKSVYLPNERTSYEPKPSALISYGKTEPNSTMIPSTVDDDIAVNNIAYSEFDYTENLIHDEEE